MKRVLITGAADGIGRALARQYGRAGYVVTGIDRDAAAAERTRVELLHQRICAHFLIADLAEPEQVVGLAADLASGSPFQILIHNAGINAVGPFQQADLVLQQAVIDVNLQAPLLLNAELLRRERLAGGGSIVFIASLSCYVGYPGAAVYAASKDGLAAYARSLAVALQPQGINVLTVFPGPTRTAHARRHSPDNRNEQRRMPPEVLAAAIYRAEQRRQRRLVPGLANRIFALLGHLAPAVTEWALRRAILGANNRGENSSR
jgi:short-subunit dehydrogenase